LRAIQKAGEGQIERKSVWGKIGQELIWIF
jgi:hypothetical protein